jgi:aryl-phospho-beta-D-glucosidase BglC (GH1 family)
MARHATFASILILVLAHGTAACLAKEPSAKVGPPPLKVEGNQLKTPDGKVVRLQGVNIASLEWTARGDHVLQSVGVAIDQWGSNAIRLPLSQDRWFGRAKEQSDGGTAYRKLIEEAVAAAAAKRCYMILDLHWSNAGVWGQNIGQHCMPDDHSVAFWEAVAAAYANHPAVLFDLYNEPYGVSWEIWRDGGTVSEKPGRAARDGLKYHSPGLQKLLDTCRAKGAKNVIVAGGLDWGYDLSGLARGYVLSDPQGNGVVYASHIYPWKKDWDRYVTVVLDKYPVLIGEVGCQPRGRDEDPKTWAPKVLDYIEKHQLSWTAWCFHPSASPCLLGDWNYTPTAHWGVPVKKALEAAAAKRAAQPGAKGP